MNQKDQRKSQNQQISYNESNPFQNEENQGSIQTPQKSITFQKSNSSPFYISDSPASPDANVNFYNTQRTGTSTMQKPHNNNRQSNFQEAANMSTPKMFHRDSNAGVISPKNSRSPAGRAQNDSAFLSMNSISYVQGLHGSEVKVTPQKQQPQFNNQSSNRVSLKNQSLENFKPIPFVMRGDQEDMREESQSILEAQMAEKNAKLKFLLGKTNEPYANYQEDVLNIKVQKTNPNMNITSSSKRQSQVMNMQQTQNDVEVWRYSNDFEGPNSTQKKSAPRKKKQGGSGKRQNGKGKEDISFQDSDIADEFDYQYSINNQRQQSPQVRMENQDSIRKIQRRELSKTPQMRQKSLGQLRH